MKMNLATLGILLTLLLVVLITDPGSASVEAERNLFTPEVTG